MFLFDSALINPERAGIPIPLQTIYPRKTFDIFSALRKFDPQNRRTQKQTIFHRRELFSIFDFLPPSSWGKSVINNGETDVGD